MPGGDGETRRSLTWHQAAIGFLLAVPLNPGFIPRSFLAPYGEAPLAVTLLFAVWLGARLLRGMLEGAAPYPGVVALAGVFAALVNIKQSAVGLLLACGVSILAVGLVHPRVPRARWSGAIALSMAPALLLYGAWRWYALSHFAVGELKPLPFAEWHFALLPEILAAIIREMARRATYFLAIGVVLVAALVSARKRPWDDVTATLSIIAGTVVLFTGFLVFTYVAHFPAEWAVRAHSYFRYMSQVSLITMLGLVIQFRAIAIGWFGRLPDRFRRSASAVSIGLVILLPLIFLPFLRFDLEPPQPDVWKLAKSAEAMLADGDKLALVLPGDSDDIAGSMMRGVMMFTPPRKALAFRMEDPADENTLRRLAAEGYRRTLIGCVPPGGLAGAPGNTAALLIWQEGVWQTQAVWYYPPDLAARRHWSALLPRQAFCGAAQATGSDN
jgi:hypothetical protein